MKFLLCFILVLTLSGSAFSQGMPIDSLDGRFSSAFPESMRSSLREVLANHYDDQRVWGLAIGDFSNDSLPDLAISLYDLSNPKREVTVHLLVNTGSAFKDVFQKKYTYFETPIEVGLTIDGSVVSVLQKFDESHWRQEGYSYYAGDLMMVDELETHKEDVPALTGKNKAMAHDLYRNYETLITKESFFSTKDNQTMLRSVFYSLPAYSRLRFVYPGYGHDMSDTSAKFIIKGAGFRRDWKDCSIKRALAAYDDDFLYISISVNDDQVWGGDEDMEKNDRVTLWFDAFNTDSRYFTKEKKGSIPQFRTQTDSTIYSVTFSLPGMMSQTPKVTASSVAALNDQQREASTNIRATVSRDTSNGVVSGYTLKARIPFVYLGFEGNPTGSYETRSAEQMFSDQPSKKKKGDNSLLADDERPIIGFTAVISDVDDPNHPDEITMQATSNFNPDDPTTFGELVLIPTGTFYGEVYPTYTKELTDELHKAGF
ncbi:MAG TPA: sugar-binding protein [Candidatus Kapabacteria bacterium]|nr:sugar-binding protein [Candidatus Kapabacteria bacterium]